MSSDSVTLVIGATGLLGGEVCRQMRALDPARRVRALVRHDSDAAKVEALRGLGAEVVVGDLKDPASLVGAMAGVTHVISTASSTLSRREGDTIDSVDRAGQLNAVSAARAAGVRQYVFVSFPPAEISFPLQDAKRAVEDALRSSGVPYTILQPAHFQEVWCSEALGFVAHEGRARIFGNGDGRLSWVSFLDVARVVVAALDNPRALGRTFTFGGHEALSQREVVAAFEKATGRAFELEVVPRTALEEQHSTAEDALHKSFVALMLICDSHDYACDHADFEEAFDVERSTVHQFAQRVAAARTDPG
jgi:uncharacterized protein YbjT (DUF2867 family)